MRVSALISSSARPSQKYSWSLCGLKSVKGSTASESTDSARSRLAGGPGGDRILMAPTETSPENA